MPNTDPRLADHFYLQGCLALQTRDYDKAIAEFTTAIHHKPGAAGALDGRAQAYLKTQDLDRAIDDSTEAVRLKPKCAPFYLTRSKVHRAMGNGFLASEDWYKAVELTELWQERFEQWQADQERGVLRSPDELNEILPCLSWDEEPEFPESEGQR